MVGGANLYVGEGSGPVFLDGTKCTGKEASLLDCNSIAATGRCSHAQDVGISCQGWSGSVRSFTKTGLLTMRVCIIMYCSSA